MNNEWYDLQLVGVLQTGLTFCVIIMITNPRDTNMDVNKPLELATSLFSVFMMLK